jgi:transposase
VRDLPLRDPQALPNALIVADHFHLVSLANKAVTEVRRRVTVDTTGHRGTAKDPIWAKRTRLLRAKERLSPEAFTKMWNGLIDNDPSGQILSAWIAKEELRKLLTLARTGGVRHDVAHQLFRFNNWCAGSTVPELERLASTIEAWWPEVLGFLQTGVTNAATEATNRTVKTAARTAYGFRNLNNQRRRVRFACTRCHRRATDR